MAENVKVPPLDEAPVTVVGSTPQSVFPFDFPFWEADDLIVYIDGLELAPSAFTVQGYYVQNGDAVEGGYGSGAVTLNSPVSNCSVTIDRLVVASRESQFSRAAPLGMPSLNSDLNKLTARQQDLVRILARALLAPVGENVPSAQDVIDAATAISNRMLTSGANVSNADTFKSNAQIVPFKPGPAPVAGSRFGADWVMQVGARDGTYEGGRWTGTTRAGPTITRTFTSADSSAVEAPAPAFLTVAYADGSGPLVDVCGIQSLAVALQNNDCVFGFNFSASARGATNCKIVGGEIDAEYSGGATSGAGSAGLLFNTFGAVDTGNAIYIYGHDGYWTNGVKLNGLNPSIGAGVSADPSGTMGSLINTTQGVFGQAAIVIGNGRTKGARMYGPASAYAELYVDTSGFTHLSLAENPLVVRNNGDTETLMSVSGSGLAVGKNAGTSAKLHVAADFSLDGVQVGRFSSADNYSAVEIYTGRGAAGNAANCGMRVRADSVTGRGINAGGTVNSGGADYAEYHRKNQRMVLAGAAFLKGAIVGLDENDELTDRWSEAISFGVKSTNPALVGGDSVFADLPSAPDRPTFEAPTYAGVAFPGDEPEEPRITGDKARAKRAGQERMAELSKAHPIPADFVAAIEKDETLQSLRSTIEAQDRWEKAERKRLTSKWKKARKQWKADKAAHAQAVAEAEALFEGVTMPAWESEYAAWLATMEIARAPFDRIAYAGRVPVNVEGASAGQYLVPVEAPGGGITAEAVNAANLTPGQSLTRLGRVRRVLEDGRPEIVVHVG